jgi:hypothetical protein
MRKRGDLEDGQLREQRCVLKVSIEKQERRR